MDEKNKKIEPHIILHLRITQDDIEKYLENKIQTSTEDIVPTILNFTYEACNIDVFTKPTSADPSPANLEDEQFEILSVTEGEYEDVFKCQKYKQFQSPCETPTNTPLINNEKYCLDIPYINLDEVSSVPTIGLTEDASCSDIKIKLVTAMCEFADANRRNEWLKSTSVWCKWCVHSFSTPPVSIPKSYVNNTFFVSGCYCSYSCAAKHLFSRSDINDTNRWTYYNLLHLLRKKILGIDENVRIKLAPPQDTLKVFGGHLSVEDFRNTTNIDCKYNKSYCILEPPMVSIIPTIEETTYSNDTRLNTEGMRSQDMKYAAPKNENLISTIRWGKNKPFIPIDKDRMKRAVDNLKVSRKTPLLEKKKTLLHYMDLKINKNKIEST